MWRLTSPIGVARTRLEILTCRQTQRRRAQNRIAQRASRDRKEQHIKSLETRLRELEERNQTLENAYVDLQERLRRSRWDFNHGLDDAWGVSEEEWPSPGR